MTGVVTSDDSGTHTITDMVGRTVTVPDNVTGVLGTLPPATTMIYMIAPDLLMGWNYQLSNQNNLIPEKYASLPNVGGWQTQSSSNYETFLSMHPDLIIEGYSLDGGEGNIEVINERQEKFGDVPVVGITNTINSTGYANSISFLGDLLGRQKEAADLNSFYNEALKTVRQATENIPNDKKVKVYIAGGTDGLSTDLHGSHHADLIELCGGTNVAQINDPNQIKTVPEQAQISMEQINTWNPDVIIVRDPSFYGKIYGESTWSKIKAVQDKHVYLLPSEPFPWVGRPPTTNQILGLYWMLHVLYPDSYPLTDLEEKTKYFYKNFYHVDITEEQLNHLMESLT